MKKTILLITTFICFLNFSYSQPGQLDPAFGTKGVVYTRKVVQPLLFLGQRLFKKMEK